MRLSEFHRAVADEFGPRAGALTTDLVLAQLGDRISVLEGLQTFPDVVPDDLVASVDAELSLR